MRGAIFCTGHDQTIQLQVFAHFLNQSDFFVKNFHLIHYNNNVKIERSELERCLAKCKLKTTIIKSNVNAGYVLGLFEGLATKFPLFRNYDYVVHTHPDVFFTISGKIETVLKEEENTKNVFIVSKIKTDKPLFNTDFFVFKPKLMKENMFSSYQNYLFSDLPAEGVLYDMMRGKQILYREMFRYPENAIFENGNNRKIDLMGLWHEHDGNKIYSYLVQTNQLEKYRKGE